MFNTIKKILLVSRPISWLNTAYPFAACYIVIGGSNRAILLIGALYFLIPYNLLLYGINDVFDYESDIKNPRKGGIEGMREQKKFHPVIVKSAIAINLPFVTWLLFTGNVLSKFVFLALLFFVLAYSVAGLRFKEIPFLDSLTSSMHFAGPLIYSLALVGFKKDFILYVVAFILWGMASHAFGAVQDILPDKQGQISSIATVIGAARTVRLSIILYGAASILLLTKGLYAGIVGAAGLLYVANIYSYRNISEQSSGSSNKAWRRFIWLNMFTGFVVTIVLLLNALK